jgi:phenylacetate-coenzyme A ligase PaaK-like adenylate-forming protein
VEEKATAIVGIPSQVLALARMQSVKDTGQGPAIRNVLLSADYVPKAASGYLTQAWGCRVFGHYGMTETGLGGGVECAALDGYHLREAALYYEIVDPETGQNVPDGIFGEVVFTTLTRKGMPLVRYRTGDLSVFLQKSVPAARFCGGWTASRENCRNGKAPRRLLLLNRTAGRGRPALSLRRLLWCGNPR